MESSARHALVHSFLEASHGNLENLKERHLQALRCDPLIYAPLARWYQDHGSLRDHHQLFPAHLLASQDQEFRDHGLVLAQRLRPYQLARMVRYSKESLHNRNRSLRSAVQFYLRRRENDPLWFDECVLRDKRSMRYLYATMHVRPSERAQQILFEERFPSDSRLKVVRQLHQLKHNPTRQAELIVQHRIQFTTALGAAGPLQPPLLRALIEVMTPQQLINHLAFLQRHGALGISGPRKAIMEKILAGTLESRVHDTKSLKALKHLQDDPELRRSLLEMSQERLRRRGRLTRPTLLMVDKSGSMEQCIEIGRMLACLCSTIADAPLWVEAFDSESFSVQASQPTFDAWEMAFRHIRAQGWTSLGATLRKLQHKNFEQILLISDGVENTRPFFCEELTRYQQSRGRPVKVFWLKVAATGHTPLEESARNFPIELETIPFQGDYYNLPNLVPMLCQQQQDESLLSQILELPLYTRSDLAHLPPGFDPRTFEIL